MALIRLFFSSAFYLFLTLGVGHAAPLKPEIADKTKTPYKYAGKLFLVGSDGKLTEQCSAQYAGANDVILTAAHCLIDDAGNPVAKGNLIFLHAYTASTPLEPSSASQVVKCVALPNDYSVLEPNHDFAFLKMEAPGNAGHFKLGSGLKENDVVTSIGYPKNFQNGRELMAVHGNRNAYSDVIIKNVQVFKGNPYGPVSSGGVWINRAAEIVGLNAKTIGKPGGSAADDNQVISPILGSKFKDLFDFANAGCSGANP